MFLFGNCDRPFLQRETEMSKLLLSIACLVLSDWLAASSCYMHSRGVKQTGLTVYYNGAPGAMVEIYIDGHMVESTNANQNGNVISIAHATDEYPQLGDLEHSDSYDIEVYEAGVLTKTMTIECPQPCPR